MNSRNPYRSQYPAITLGWALVLLVVSGLWAGGAQADNQPDEAVILRISNGSEVKVSRFGSEVKVSRFGSGDNRILWLPDESGTSTTALFPVARSMADLGLEVWLSNSGQIPEQDMAEMIALSLPDKKEQRLYLLSSGRGAALAATGLKAWQTARGSDQRFGGLIFAYPDFTVNSAAPDQEISYLPVSYASYAPIYIFQPGKPAQHTHLEELLPILRTGGSQVFVQALPGVGDGYLQRTERNEDEWMEMSLFPAKVRQAIEQLATVKLAPLPPSLPTKTNTAKAESAESEAAAAKPQDTLQPHPGNELAPPLQLADMQGKVHDLQDYRGKVVLLNFWATWCPPCIKEIPSLNRLQAKFPAEQFVILSVDMGEEAADVAAFLKNIPADYPVMLDADGDLVQSWKLHAFPTTFVIDRQGYLRLSYFGGLEWDAPEVVNTLETALGLQAVTKQ